MLLLLMILRLGPEKVDVFELVLLSSTFSRLGVNGM